MENQRKSVILVKLVCHCVTPVIRILLDSARYLSLPTLEMLDLFVAVVSSFNGLNNRGLDSKTGMVWRIVVGIKKKNFCIFLLR